MALLFAGPAALVPAQDLQVITFTYQTAQGIEEDDEEELEPTYVRHTLLTSVRQDLGDAAASPSARRARSTPASPPADRVPAPRSERRALIPPRRQRGAWTFAPVGRAESAALCRYAASFDVTSRRSPMAPRAASIWSSREWWFTSRTRSTCGRCHPTRRASSALRQPHAEQHAREA